MDNPVFVTEKHLARTFDGGVYDDAYEAVEQYRTATRYASRHNVKSGATASALDLPRGRLRGWIDDGGAPDAINCIETAREYGWLEVTYEDTQFTALNALVANVFSGGSIAHHHYRPSFVLNNRGEDSHVVDALELAGVDYELVGDRPGRGDELRPSTDGTTLGRVLATLGAPVGPKAEQRLELPAYLEDAPNDVKRLFVVCYLENRAHEHKSIIKFREERNADYLESLRALIESVAGEPVTHSEKNIILSKAASDALGTVV
ncbi:hypothetical protein ACLI4U_18945 (plasmid) [Natrialbaceae archaeon A-CW2]